MAYSKFNLFHDYGQGGGTPPEYGTTPQTYESDLALITRSPDYAALKQINARVAVPNGTPHDITIWVGLKKSGLSLEDHELNENHVVDLVAIPCPPYSRPLIAFNTQEELVNEL